MRRALAAGLVVVCVTAPAAASGPDARVTTYVVERIGSAPRAMTGTLRITARDALATVVVVGVEQRGGRAGVRRVTRVESGGRVVHAELYGPELPITTPGCADVGTCAAPVRAPDAPLRISTDSAPTTLAFVVTYVGADVAVDPGSGWRKRRVPGGRLVVVANRSAGGSGARAGRLSVEHFTGASVAAAGPSVAFAAIPCPPDPYLLGRPGGHGEAVLTGGDRDRGHQQMRCADRTWTAYAVASGPTRWHLRGDVTGYTSQLVRLAVVVLPSLRA